MEPTPHNCTRGQIFLADLEPVIGSEQGGKRPVLIIQNNAGNKHSPTVIVAPITTKSKKVNLPVHIALPESKELPRDSIVLFEQIRTIDKSRLIRYLGYIYSQKIMKDIEAAICVSVGVSPTRQNCVSCAHCGAQQGYDSDQKKSTDDSNT